MDTFMFAFENPFDLYWLVLGGVAVVAIVFGAVTKILTTRAREQTRREIAAYVAEGTIEPDKGIEMMRACRLNDEKPAKAAGKTGK